MYLGYNVKCHLVWQMAFNRFKELAIRLRIQQKQIVQRKTKQYTTPSNNSKNTKFILKLALRNPWIQIPNVDTRHLFSSNLLITRRIKQVTKEQRNNSNITSSITGQGQYNNSHIILLKIYKTNRTFPNNPFKQRFLLEFDHRKSSIGPRVNNPISGKQPEA